MQRKLSVKISAKLDEEQSKQEITNQLNNFKFNPIKIKVELDTADLNAKIRETQNKLKEAFKGINVGFKFTNPNIQSTQGGTTTNNANIKNANVDNNKFTENNIQNVKLVSELNNMLGQINGKVIDCTTTYDKVNDSLSASIKYYNEQGEILTKILHYNSENAQWEELKESTTRKDATEQKSLLELIEKKNSILKDTLLTTDDLAKANKEMSSIVTDDSLSFNQKKIAIGEITDGYLEQNSLLETQKNNAESLNNIIEKEKSKLEDTLLSQEQQTQAVSEMTDVLNNQDLTYEQKKIAIDKISNSYKEQNKDLQQQQKQEQDLLNLIEQKQSVLSNTKGVTEDSQTEALTKMHQILEDDNLTYNQKKIKINEVTNAYKQQASELVKQQTLEQKLSDAEIRFKENVENSNLSVKKRTELQSKYNNIVSSSDNTEDKVNAVKRLDTEVNVTAKNTKSLNYLLTNAFTKFNVWMVVTDIFYKSAAAFKSMYTIVISLDSALTELKKVTDASNKSLKDITVRAYEASTQLGRTGQEVLEASSEWARAGYTLEDSFDLAKISLLFTNIADGIDNVTEASSSLISIMSGFNLDSSDATKIVDILNEISNTQPINTSNITTALKTVAGVAGQAGNSLEETSAMITAIFKTLRSPEKTSTGLNYIIMQLSGLDEDGNTVDGLTSSMQNLFDTYANGKIKMTDENGELRSTWDILSDLANEWDNLTKNQQTYIAQTVGGKRQARALISLMSNWTTAQDALNSALTSSGSAARENAVYIDSINGRIAVLKSNFQQLAQQSVESDWIKNIVGSLGDLLSLISKSGGLIPVFASIASILTVIKSKNLSLSILKVKDSMGQIIPKMKSLLSTLKFHKRATDEDSISELKANAQRLKSVAILEKKKLAEMQEQKAMAGNNWTKEQEIKLEQQATVAKKAGVEATSALTKATNAASTVLSTALKWIGIALTAFTFVCQIIETVKSNNEASAKALEEYNNKQKDFNKTLADYIDKYQKLKETQKNATGDELVSTNEELKNIQQEIVNMLGNQANGIDLVNGKYSDQLKTLKDIYLQRKKDELDTSLSNKIVAQSQLKDAGSQDKGFLSWNNIKQAFSSFDNNSIMSQIRNAMGEDKWASQTLNDELDNLGYEDRIAKLKEWQQALIIASNNGKNVANALAWVNEVLAQCTESQEKYDTAVQDVVDNYAILQWYKDFADTTVTSKDSYDDLIDKINNTDFDSEELNTYGLSIDDVKNALISMAQNAYPQFAKSIEDTNDMFILSEEEMKNFKQTASDLVSSISSLSSAWKEMSENGELSASTVLKLIDSGYGEALYYDELTGKIKLNKDALLQLYKAKLQLQQVDTQTNLDKITQSVAQQAGIATNVGDTYEKVSAYVKSIKEEESALESIGENNLSSSQKDRLEELKSLDNELVNNWLTLNNIVDVYKSLSENSSESILGSDDAVTQAENVANALKDINSAAKNAASSIKTLSSAIKEQNENGSLSIDTALNLIENGYASALSFDSETGAIKLNIDACKELMKVKLQVAITEAELKRDELIRQIQEETNATDEQTKSYLENAKAKIAAGTADKFTMQVTKTNSTTKTKKVANQQRYNKDARPMQYDQEEWSNKNNQGSTTSSSKITQEVDITQEVKTVLDTNAYITSLKEIYNNLDKYLSGHDYDTSSPTGTDAYNKQVEKELKDEINDAYQHQADVASAWKDAYNQLYKTNRITIDEYYKSIAKCVNDNMFDAFRNMSNADMFNLLSSTDDNLKGQQALLKEYIDLTEELNNISLDKIKQRFDELNKEVERYGTEISKLGDIDTLEEQMAQASYLGNEYDTLCDAIQELIEKQKQYNEESEEYAELQEEIDGLIEKRVSIEDKVKDIAKEVIEQKKENALLEIENEKKKQLLDIEKQLYGDEGKDAYEHNYNEKVNAIQKEIDALNEKKDTQDAINQGIEYENKLKQLQLDLIDALNNKTTKVLTKQANGTWQFEYTADQDKVDEIKQNIKDTTDEYNKWQFEQQINALESQKDSLESIKDSLDEKYSDAEYHLNKIEENQKAVVELQYADIDKLVSEELKDLNAGTVSVSDKLQELTKLLNEENIKNNQLTIIDKVNDLYELQGKLNEEDRANSELNLEEYQKLREENLKPIQDEISEIIDNANSILDKMSNNSSGVSIDLGSLSGVDLLSTSTAFNELADYIKSKGDLNALGSTINISKIEFPNCTSDIKEIQNALIGLPAVAMQYANKK